MSSKWRNKTDRKLTAGCGEKVERMNRKKIACNCKNITYGMIEDAIIAGAKSYEDVEKQLRFGTGCGKCKEFIRFLVRDILEGKVL